jgi:hypothetical protein
MARIRSIHPGLFTDERFLELTVLAPLGVAVYIGLLTEADDNGVFEWKPVTIKTRTIPAVTEPVEPLLAHLTRLDFVAPFSADGKRYGVIRNFLKYQRPQKPSTKHPTNPTVLQYSRKGDNIPGMRALAARAIPVIEPAEQLSIPEVITPPAPVIPVAVAETPKRRPPQSAKGSGINLQREEGGGNSRRKEVPPPTPSEVPHPEAVGGGGGKDFQDVAPMAPPDPATQARAEIVKQAKPPVIEQAKIIRDWAEEFLQLARPVYAAPFISWIEKGASIALIQTVIEDVMRAQHNRVGKSWKPGGVEYFNRKIVEAVAAGKGIAQVEPGSVEPPRQLTERETWEHRQLSWNGGHAWSTLWGPEPDQEGCQMPVDLQENCLPRNDPARRRAANGG